MNRRRAAILLAWLALLAGALGVAWRAPFTADMSAFLPHSPDARQRVLVEQLRDGLLSRLLLVGIDGATPRVRAELSTRLAQRLRELPGFASADNGGGTRGERDFALAFAHRYLLSPAPQAFLAPSGGGPPQAQAFGAAALHRAIAASIAQLAGPLGDGLKRLLPADPTGATLGYLGALGPRNPPRHVDGVWASPDGTRALLLVVARAPGTDTDAQQAALGQLREAFAQVRLGAGPAAAGASLVLSGPAVFATYSRGVIEHAVTRVSLLGAALIVTLLLLVYRSAALLLLGLLPVLTGIVAATAAVGLGFGVVQGITLGFGTALMGEAVDYSIYLFVQSGPAQGAQGPDGAQDARRAWVRGFWPTVRLGMLTSMVGFASLLLSDFPGLAQIGAYSMAGVFSAALVTRFVLPELMPRGLRVRDLSRAGRHLERAVRGLRRLRRPLALLVLACAGLLLAQRHHVWDDRLSALSPIPQRMLDADATLRQQLGAADSGDLVALRGPSQEAVLQAAEALAPRLRALREQGLIGGFDSPARYLPSARTQRARQAALPDTAQLEASLRAAVAGLPVKASLFQPFVADVAAARRAPLLRREDLAHSSFALALDGMLLRQRRAGAESWTALLPLRAPAGGAIDLPKVEQALRGSGALVVDLGATSNQLYRRYLHTAIGLSLAGVLGMSALLLLALRSARRVARVLAPLLAAVLVVAAGLVLLGQRLNLLHLVGMMLVIAAGSNYALFFDRGRQHGGVGPRTLSSLLFANLSTVAGFGPLLLSGVPVLVSLGATVAPGALLALLFSAVLSENPEGSADAQA
ncbi:MAG: MMPL family transporter [Betaproteobacteria bacterium]|nr:MMPL family transporter [Betaproteobacteria bacterium]